MFSNHILTAWRNLRREQFFSALNILGLAAALTCTALISVWVWDEWRRDRFFPNADRIVRVVAKLISEKESFDQAVTSVQVGPNLQNDYPEVESYCRLDMNKTIVTVGQQRFLENNLLTVDSTFFEVFNYALRNGNVKNALTEPYTVVLTEKMAKKYFGDQDPVGQTVNLNLYQESNEGATYRVTGVLSGEPRPSHFEFDMLVSFASFFKYKPDYLGEDGWHESSYYTYILLRPGAQKSTLEAKMPGFFQKHLAPLWKNTRVEFSLQALSDVYLTSNRRYEIAENGNAAHLYIFASVGLLILFVAGINYVNMATARAAKRARSVGVRKALGAQRGQLALQFLVESVLTAFFAAGLALLFGHLFQPVFANMTDKPLGIFDLPYLPLGMVAATLLLGLCAGAYPAFVLSGYQPVKVLKGSVGASKTGGTGLRQSLVVAQFVVSIALIISMLVIRGQMGFIQNKNLGFNKESVLTISTNGSGSVYSGIESFKNEVTANTSLVQGMAFSNVLPVGGTGNSSATTVDNTGKKVETSTYRMRVNYDYVPVMGLKLLAGRNFSREFPADSPTDTSQNYLLNAAAVRAFGWETPEQAIGKPFRTHGKQGQVVGIVEDFNFNSLKHKVEPLCIHLSTNNFYQILVRVQAARAQESIAFVEEKWKQHFPDAMFNYAFLDAELDTQYRSEMRFGALFGAFSLFSIFIACLGLIGLSAYTAERRTKEIGIRKVLGASVAGITGLLAKDFLALVLVAIVIATPIAYYFMQAWLSDFAYRIEMEWWMFAAAGAAAVLIAFLTVCFQSVRAALADPVKSLRSE
jgi:putative ABC transport system permease protein